MRQRPAGGPGRGILSGVAYTRHQTLATEDQTARRAVPADPQAARGAPHPAAVEFRAAGPEVSPEPAPSSHWVLTAVSSHWARAYLQGPAGSDGQRAVDGSQSLSAALAPGLPLLHALGFVNRSCGRGSRLNSSSGRVISRDYRPCQCCKTAAARKRGPVRAGGRTCSHTCLHARGRNPWVSLTQANAGTHAHTHTHKQIQAHTHTHAREGMCACMGRRRKAGMHTCTQTCRLMHIHVHAGMLHMHTDSCTSTDAHMHTCMHTPFLQHQSPRGPGQAATCPCVWRVCLPPPSRIFLLSRVTHGRSTRIKAGGKVLAPRTMP